MRWRYQREGKKEKLRAEGVSSPGCVAILLTSGKIIIKMTQEAKILPRPSGDLKGNSS